MLWFPVQVRAGPPLRESIWKRKNFQSRQQLHIGGGKLKTGGLRSFDPAKIRNPDLLRLAGKDLAEKKFQADGFFRIIVGNFFKQFADGNFNPQFLANLTNQASFKSFARLALAAGKFPKSAEMRFGVALRDEQFAVAENQRGRKLR